MNKNMKIKVALFFAFLVSLNCSFTYGQISREDYQKSVNYLNCRVVELALRKSPAKGVVDRFQSEIKKRASSEAISNSQPKTACNSSLDLNKIKESIDLTEVEALNLSIEIDKIRDDRYQPELKEDVIKYLSTNIFNEQEKYPLLFGFANKHRDSIQKLGVQLNQDFSNLLSTKAEVPVDTNTNSNTVNNSTNNSQNSNSTNTNGGKGDSSTLANLFYWIYILLPIIAFLATTFTYWHLHKRLRNISQTFDRRLKVVEKKPNPQSQPTGVTTSKTGIKDLEDRLRINLENALKIELDRIEKRVESLEDKDREKLPSEVTISRTHDYQQDKEPQKEYFYFPKPNEDGTFNLSSLQLVFKEGDSIYKFKKITDTSAKFKIDERESSTLMALRYPEAVIEPACEAQNSRSDSEKRIVTVEPGKAELIGGDRWKVTKKAVIKYE